jgi:hypothetical protein
MDMNRIITSCCSGDESRWTQPGDIATHPSMTNSALSTNLIKVPRGWKFWKITNIKLSYNFPGAVTSQLKLTGLSVGITIDNPLRSPGIGDRILKLPLLRETLQHQELAILSTPITGSIYFIRCKILVCKNIKEIRK